MSNVDEAAFEAFICQSLLDNGGYTAVKVGNAQPQPDFDVDRALDTAELFSFIGTTQPEAWNRLLALHGGQTETAQRAFTARLTHELDRRGTVDVLRHGVVDLGVTIRLVFFRPASAMSPEASERYAKNRLTVTRQLPYEPGTHKTLDLCLFVNGLPVATAELKNALTGQDIADAVAQYCRDRDPKNLTLRRAIVHFAVDTEAVAMTTRLAGRQTRFLPFNRGTRMGAGNPPNPDGHRSAYLWERVWARDAWLDLLQRFVHVEPTPKGSKAAAATIFPRFHQWDAVLSLTADARARGAGHNYLVQHSAGSGKSNSIAWLAHRLSSLHDTDDTKVFDKVVVITDRRVLDKQLQDTIYQFEHTHGVVMRIDTDSKQLAEALEGEQARIIITTLQKFPYVTDKIASLPERTYAVIVDEAHSSQTGDSAAALKGVLGVGAAAAGDDDADSDADGLADPAEDLLAAYVAAKGRQENLSFFAFTATPKARTLELFGSYDEGTDRYEPFHLYSMRQAIEEGFILDVLANYTTYATYWAIENAEPDDPEYDPGRARAAIARFVNLHPHNLAQRAEIIVEHFRQRVADKLAGQAKAMVVASSREHAARYALALRDYIATKGYADMGVLVAFSGSLDLDGGSVTEASMNGFGDTETAERFDTDAWQIMVVAEKYQTGFDQPKLYAMYVDKPLSGLAAVQTLSRLNRTYDKPGAHKDATFVLDFRNDAEEIRAAFEPWFGQTVAPPTDPNLMYDTRRELDEFGILRADEIERVVHALLTGSATATAQVSRALAPAVDRFDHDLGEDERDRFRDALNRFVKTYAFLSQVVSFTDANLEADYRFCKALAALIHRDGSIAVSPDVALTHLKLEETFTGSVALEDTDGQVVTTFSGSGKLHEPEPEPLSQIIDELNQRFGTDFDDADRVFFDTIANKLVERPDIQEQAAVNTPENFGLILGKEFQAGVLDQLATNEEMAVKYLDTPEMQTLLHHQYGVFVQTRATVLYQEYCDIAELLGPDKESASLEYKATLRNHADSGELFKPLETATLKTIAAFGNSRYGGTLLLGVADDGTIHGLEADYATFKKKRGMDRRDQFMLHLGNIMSAALGDAAATNVRTQILAVDGHDIARIQVDPCGFPVEAKVIYQKPGEPAETRTQFFVRVGNATKPLDAIEKEKYLLTRWPGR